MRDLFLIPSLFAAMRSDQHTRARAATAQANTRSNSAATEVGHERPDEAASGLFVRSKTIGPTHSGAVSYGAYGASGNGTDQDQETGPSKHELELSCHRGRS